MEGKFKKEVDEWIKSINSRVDDLEKNSINREDFKEEIDGIYNWLEELDEKICDMNSRLRTLELEHQVSKLREIIFLQKERYELEKKIKG